MEALLTKTEHYIGDADTIDTKISKASVGWHLYHILVVINIIYKALEASNPKDYKREFNFMRFVLFTFNKIPRGKAKAPKVVRPPEIIDVKDIHHQLKEAKKHMQLITELPKEAHFKHPYFGILNVKQTIYFLEMHTNHHLKIVRDILK